MRKAVFLSVCAALLVACSGSSEPVTSPSPTPTPTPTPAATTRPSKDVTYTSGSAQVSVTGGAQASFEASLDPTAGATGYSPDDGFDVWWRSGDQALNVSGDVKKGEADVFIRIETGAGDENAYVDSFHNICDVTVTAYSDTELAGTFTCPQLPSWGAESVTIDATGTFQASAP